MKNYNINDVVKFTLALDHNVNFKTFNADLIYKGIKVEEFKPTVNEGDSPFVIIAFNDKMKAGEYFLRWNIEINDKMIEIDDRFTLEQEVLEVEIDDTLPMELQYLA